jgi:hypothetical protein
MQVHLLDSTAARRTRGHRPGLQRNTPPRLGLLECLSASARLRLTSIENPSPCFGRPTRSRRIPSVEYREPCCSLVDGDLICITIVSISVAIYCAKLHTMPGSGHKPGLTSMMRFELGLEKPNPRRVVTSAGTIAGAYIAGGWSYGARNPSSGAGRRNICL